MKRKIKFLVTFLFFICAPYFTFAQSPQSTNTEIEEFKTRLDRYFFKHKRSDNSQMPVKQLGNTNSGMPTVNLRSLMIDKEIGLAFEFSTKKIFDQETDLVYDMKSEMIYCPTTDEFYEYEKPDFQTLYYRELTPSNIIFTQQSSE